MRDTLGADLGTVPGHKARRRQVAAVIPPHQIVSTSFSQSESPVAVDLRNSRPERRPAIGPGANVPCGASCNPAGTGRLRPRRHIADPSATPKFPWAAPDQTAPVPRRGFLPWRLSDAGPAPCISARARGRHPKPSYEGPLSQAQSVGLGELRLSDRECSLPTTGGGNCWNSALR